MSYLYPKREKKEITLTKEEWYKLLDKFLDLTNETESCNRKTREAAGELAEVIFKIGNKGNWR
jgi:hypothetical protein